MVFLVNPLESLEESIGDAMLLVEFNCTLGSLITDNLDIIVSLSQHIGIEAIHIHEQGIRQ